MDRVQAEFGIVRNIFLAYAYGSLGKMTQLKSLLDIMAKDEDFYMTKPEVLIL